MVTLPDVGTRPQPTKLEDVAAAVGVSLSTASRALRGHPAVSKGTTRRVRAAADRLGYEPNRTARALRTRTSPFIGIVVPDITIPFFSLAVKAAQDVFEQAGYQALLMNTHRDARQEREALRTLLSHQAQGVLLATYGGHEAAGRIPLVFFANFDASVDVPRVALSNREGIRVLVEHLIGHGHERIAYVGGTPSVTSGGERLLSFQQTMRAAGLEGRMLVRLSDETWLPESIERAVAELLHEPEPPTAFVTGSDNFALGALKAIRAAGLRIPDDVALVTFQDPDRMGGVLEPPLTTIATQERQLGEHAAKLLLQILGSPGVPVPALEIRLPAELVVRRSCGCGS